MSRFSPKIADEIFIDLSRGEETINIGCVLTYKCPFKCDHCMYGCGPDRPSMYMSNQTLSNIEDAMMCLHNFNLFSEINLIGGEPTINLKRFAEICEWASNTGVPVQMSTNGWWLERPSTSKKFFDAMKYLIPDFEEGAVRISDDKWHQGFHKRNYKMILDELDASGLHPYSENDEDNSEYGYECKKWIYIEEAHWVSDDQISPAGVRGRWGGADHGANGSCSWNYNQLGYRPNGKLGDCCGFGSNFEFGTSSSDPVLMLSLVNYFKEKEIKENGNSCINCRSVAKDFRQSSEFRTAKKYFERKLSIASDDDV